MIDKICKLAETKEYSVTELASIFNTYPAKIRNILKENNIKTIREFQKERNKQICEMAKKEDLSIISEKFGISVEAIRQILRDNNISAKKIRSDRLKKRNNEICKLAKTGKYSTSDLGKMFNLNYSYIGEILQKNKIDIQKYHERKYGPDVYKKCTRDNAKRDKDICKMAKKFYPVSLIAEKHNLSDTHILNILHKNNIYIRQLDLGAKIISLYDKGYSISEIAQRVHKSEQCVVKHLGDTYKSFYLEKLEKKNKYLQEIKPDVLKDYTRGTPFKKILAKYNITQNDLYNKILPKRNKI